MTAPRKQHKRAGKQTCAAACSKQQQQLQVLDNNTKRVVRIDAHFDNPARYFFHLHVKAGDQLWAQCVQPTDPEHGQLAWLGTTILHYHVRMEVLRRSPPSPASDPPKALSAAAAAYTGPEALAELDTHFHLRAWRQAQQPDAWRLGPLRMASVLLACLGAAHRLHAGELDEQLVVAMMDVMDGEVLPGVCCCKTPTKVRGWLWNTTASPLCCHPGVPAEPTGPSPPPAAAWNPEPTPPSRHLHHTVSLPAAPTFTAAAPTPATSRGPAAPAATGAKADHWSGWDVVNTQQQDNCRCSSPSGPSSPSGAASSCRTSDNTSGTCDSEEAVGGAGAAGGAQGPPAGATQGHISPMAGAALCPEEGPDPVAPITHRSVSVVASRSMVGRAMIRAPEGTQ